ncbi:hypothetical protein [Demequina sp.]|uniref:hypothetical protein n=1 Tax=Demequina sp. TaxID=2050685 RepID=UPI0025EAE7F7|nr:hypothetical protein [Demequina sp.]
MDHRDDAAAWAAPTPADGATDHRPAATPAVDYGVPQAAAPGPVPTPPAPPAPTWQAAPGPVPAAMPSVGHAPTYASWQPGFMPLRPLSFGDLLGLPFRAMRYNRGVIIGGPLLLTLVATVATAAAMWLLFTDPSLGLLDPNSTFSAISPTTIAVGVVALVAALLADVLSSAIVAPGVARGVLGERIRLGDAWRAMRPRVGSLLLLYLIAGGSMLVVVGLALTPLMLSAVNNDATYLGLGLLLMVTVAFPAGVLISTIGGISRPVVVLEQRGAVAAIRRAVALVRGRFWWSLLVVFVASALIGIVSSVLQQVGSFGAVAVAFAAPDNVVALAIAFFTVTALSLVVSYVLTYSYLGSLFSLVYIDLRIRHEGFDLTLAEAAEARRA